MSRSTVGQWRTVRDAVLQIERRFRKAGLYFGHGTDHPRDEAAWLVSATLGIPFGALDRHADRSLSGDETERLLDVAERRVTTRKPLAYLLNEAWFAGRRFYVDERVIVPRSIIGEFLPNQFRPWADLANVRRILDLCTGSGCIAVAAALAFPQAQVDAADISEAALAVARINIESFGLTDRVKTVRSDLFSGLGGRRYGLIVSNPPYVDARDMAELPDEYRHEPELALASGPDGLEAIVKILGNAPDHLDRDGVLIAEVGNSRRALQRRFPAVPWQWLRSPSGDESLFMIDRARLVQHHAVFRDVYR